MYDNSTIPWAKDIDCNCKNAMIDYGGKQRPRLS